MTMSRSQAASKASKSRSHESRVEGGKKAAANRDNASLREAGRKGGQHSQGGKSSKKDDDRSR